MSEQVDVFFDESGKDKNQVSLMGALLMPHNYYTCDDIVTINNELKQNKFRLHFTDFSKDSQVPLHRAIRSVFQKPDYLKLNVVAFKKNDHISRHHFLSNKGVVSKMIYAKIPERVLYGVLRHYGNFTEVEAKLMIEECSQYINEDLAKRVKEQLNVHSLYRNEHFYINQAGLYPKNKEIGIEMTDALLGIIRTIIENKDAKSKTLRLKKKFIARNLVYLKPVLENVNYYELNGHSSLENKNFSPYINLFLSKFDNESAVENEKRQSQ